GLQRAVQPGREFLGLALAVAAVQAQAALGAALGQPAALDQRLPHGHAALEAVRPGALHLAVHIELRRPVHIDDIAAGDEHVLLLPPAQEQAGDVDLLAVGLAGPLSGQDRDVGAAAGNSARECDYLRDPGIEGLHGEAPGTVDRAEYRYLAAADLHRQDVHLRLGKEVAALQRLGDGLLRADHRHAADLDRADQRIADGAVLADPGFQGEVG